MKTFGWRSYLYCDITTANSVDDYGTTERDTQMLFDED